MTVDRKMEEAPCLRIHKSLGEKTILILKVLKLLDGQFFVKKSGDYVIIPLSRRPKTKQATILMEQLREVEISKDRFEKRRQTKTLHEALADKLPSQFLKIHPRSIDILGRVALVNIPTELERYKTALGEAILESNKSVETVLAKAGAVSGKYRLRKCEIIAGTEITKTTYKEHGCLYHLDPTEVYFSPRLSQERWRITQKVTEREEVIDMFAGVGPFSIQIAKKHTNVNVYAIDANPRAIQFLKLNIDTNKVSNVFPLEGDAREVIERRLIGKADRVIMNLPEKAIEFIDVACKALKTSGGIIHYYGFEADPNALKKAKKKLNKKVLKHGKNVEKVLDSRFVRSTAPHNWQVAIDILVS